MISLMEYVKTTGDCTFFEKKFNEVDAIVLSAIAYVNFTGIVKTENIELGVALNTFLSTVDTKKFVKLGILQKDILKLEKMHLYDVYVDISKEDSFEKTDFTKTPISKMKDFLIADPWLGVVDYAPNIAVLYKHHPDYNRCVGSPENFDNLDDFIPKFKLEDYYLYPQDYHLKEMTVEDKKYFIDNHPELIIDKKELIKH